MAWTGKLAVVSHVLPPSSSGQAVMLYRLLRNWDPERYCLVSIRDYTKPEAVAADAVTHRLAAQYYHLPPEKQFRLLESRAFALARELVTSAGKLRGLVRKPLASATVPVFGNIAAAQPRQQTAPSPPSLPWRLWKRCRSMLQRWDDRNLPRQVAQRARAIGAVVRKERCSALLATSSDLIDPPAAFLAARDAGIPYFSYMFDDYATQWIDPSERAFAQAAVSQVIQNAAGVIVPNEFLADVYRENYGVEALIVRNPVEDVPPMTPRRTLSKPFRIVFTGTIYEAHFDAFIAMGQALTRFPAGEVEFHIYTMSDPAYLAQHGVGAPATMHPSVSSAAALEIQRSADALFLPLAFHSPYPDIINTSAPGKMGEYFASGRPVLVHAPRESFLAWYCRRHACAAVVDTPSVDLLYSAILKLIQTPASADAIVQNAWQRACEDFHLPQVQHSFQRIFEQLPAAA